MDVVIKNKSSASSCMVQKSAHPLAAACTHCAIRLSATGAKNAAVRRYITEKQKDFSSGVIPITRRRIRAAAPMLFFMRIPLPSRISAAEPKVFPTPGTADILLKILFVESLSLAGTIRDCTTPIPITAVSPPFKTSRIPSFQVLFPQTGYPSEEAAQTHEPPAEK